MSRVPLSPSQHLILKGYRQAQLEIERQIREFNIPTGYFVPGGTGGPTVAVKAMVQEAYVYARSVTHVKTGTLSMSHRMFIKPKEGTARIYLVNNINPVTGDNAKVYGVTEHDRGGDHAFYTRTVREHGGAVLNQGILAYESVVDDNPVAFGDSFGTAMMGGWTNV